MTPTIYTRLAYFSWIALFLVWLPGYFTTKRAIARPNPFTRYLALALLILGFVFLFSQPWGSLNLLQYSPASWAQRSSLTPRTTALGVIGLVFDLAGVAFAIWARITLGTNWSNVIALKESHELVQSGPYAIVRHPIYTGVLFATLGVALTIGSFASYLGFVFVLGALLIRICDEDALMAQQFPDQHAGYKRRTKVLIPFIL